MIFLRAQAVSRSVVFPGQITMVWRGIATARRLRSSAWRSIGRSVTRRACNVSFDPGSHLRLVWNSPHKQPESPQTETNSPQSAGNSPQTDGGSPHSGRNSPHSPSDSPQSAAQSPPSQVAATFPAELLALAEPARRREKLPAAEMRTLIERLCTGRWLSARELGALLSRDPDNLQTRILTSLVRDGRLQLRHPDVPNRPDQAYRTRETS